MQLTTVGRTIWKGASQGARLAEAGAGDPDVQGRLRKVKLVKALREGKRSWGEIQELLGISRATYYRWERALRERGLAGLKPKSRRPKRTRGKVQWKPELLVRVEVLRRANPTWGRWPIWLTLRKEGFSVSERTVGRILAYLEGSGRVESVASFLARRGRGKGRGRPRRPYARRKPRGYQLQAPGDLIQVDTLMVSLGPGEVVRHFSAVDLPGAPSSTGTWSGCNGLLGMSFTPDLCPRGLASYRWSLMPTWTTTTAGDPTWPWVALLP